MSPEKRKRRKKGENKLNKRIEKKRHLKIMLQVRNGADDDCNTGGGLV